MERKTAVGKAQDVKWLIVTSLLVAFSMFLVGFDNNLYFFGGAYIMKDIGVNDLFLGITATGFAAGITIFSLVGGIVFDKITTRNGIIVSLGIITVFSTLTGFSRNWYELLVFRFLVGFGVGMIQPQVSAFLGGLKVSYRATVIASAGFFFMIGLAVSPMVFAAFSTSTTFDIPFILAGIAGLALMALIAAFVPAEYKIKEPPKKGMLANLNSAVILASVSYLAFGIAYFAYLGYFTPYLLADGLSKGEAALAISSFGVAGLILSYPGALLGDRADRKMAVQLGALLIFVGALLAFSLKISFGLALASVALLGAGYAIYGNINAYVQEAVEDQWRGTAIGFMFTLFNVGSMIGGSLMGFLVVAEGYRMAGYLCMVLPLAFSLAIASGMPKKAIKTGI
ncbi:MAG: MFS transporter [TACK group archaeon]|nr:MFS transporter [TACK group archaeon]